MESAMDAARKQMAGARKCAKGCSSLMASRAGFSRLNLDAQPFVRRDDFGKQRACPRLLVANGRVGLTGVVMEKDQLARATRLRQLCCLFEGAVAPTLLGGDTGRSFVLLRGVLRVVDQQVGTARELQEPVVDPPFVVLGVGRVDYGLAALIDAEREDPLRMIASRVRHENSAARAVIDLHRLGIAQVAKRHPRAHRSQVDWEVRMVHLTCEGLFERSRHVVAAIQVEHVARHERGLEERETLDVVPVHVAEEHVSFERHLAKELLPEESQPRAAVEDEDGLAGPHLDAAGVSSDLGSARPRCGNAAANSPEGDLHPALRSQGLRAGERVPRQRGEGYSLSVPDRSHSGAAQPTVDAVVVLGCRVRVDQLGRLRQEALARRIDAAALAYAERGQARTVVIASGGRHWNGLVEADVMARELLSRGVPEHAIVRERCSLTTCDNARFTVAAMARRGITHAAVVTCDWHLPRAVALFRRAGVSAEGVAARQHDAPWTRRVWWRCRERALAWLQMTLALLAMAACSRRAPEASTPPAAPAASSGIEPEIEKAEDLRRAKDVPTQAQRQHDPAVRRMAARAFARILGADDEPLLRALEDSDDATIAWAAYGLGESCKGREERHEHALAARLASLDTERVRPPQNADARSAIVRALGRCGGGSTDQTLRAYLRARTTAQGQGSSATPSRRREFDEAVVYALGDLAAKRGSLPRESAIALLDLAQGTDPFDAALYPFGRVDASAEDPFEARLAAAARAALGRPGPARIYAVRALARGTRSIAPAELSRVLSSDDFGAAERAEAARALGRLHEAGQTALAVALVTLLRDTSAITGDRFPVLLAAVTALGDRPPSTAEPALWAATRIDVAPGSPANVARRASAVRCAAAERLARGAWDSDVLTGCDVADGEAGERARLAALDRGPLVRARRAAWLELAHKTKHVRVREAALDAIALHPELGDAARAVLAEALRATEPGVVATAASVVRAHPERVDVLAERERGAALDPRSPPPTANPERVLDPAVAGALRAAMAHPWSEDLVETRAALVDAALAVGLDEARSYAESACHDANATMRARAAAALAAAGDVAKCSPPDAPGDPAPEIGHFIERPTRVVLETDAGTLGITFDPTLAPIAATRFVALARSGFYTGISVHRVIPGFVVQLGDRGGDGYGGSGGLLRCETSPVEFAAFDVGVALSGRDTGSSQLFVALARYPHLDGQYARVGRAEGNWDAVAEGDMVRTVHVEE